MSKNDPPSSPSSSADPGPGPGVDPSRGSADDRLTRPPWRTTLESALDTAERGVAGYYAISPREWSSRFRYDLGSDADHPGLDFPPGTLAQIVRMEILASPRPPRWRIVLRDAAILALRHQVDLHALLAHTLAHELVHLVRFASGLAPFDPHHGFDRGEEEERVCRIAREAVARLAAEHAAGAPASARRPGDGKGPAGSP